MIFNYPWYFILICMLIGILYSVLLYGGKKKNKVNIVLACIRFLTVTVIALLLLSPLVKRTTEQYEKPIIIIAEDNSQSLNFCGDSAYYHTDYRTKMEHLVATLSDDYEVAHYFYDQAPYTPSEEILCGNSTNIANTLSSLTSQYAGRNIGAIVLTGDGIYNAGSNPTAAIDNLAYPIYTVALGDSAMRHDAALINIKTNRIAYLGNQFPLEITLRATHLRGAQQQLRVSSEGKTLYNKSLTYTEEDFTYTETLVLDADKEGLRTYTVTITPANNEVSLRNNTRSFSINVIDGHEKIAIVAATPHPDIAALKHAIESNQNYEVSTLFAQDVNSPKALNDYSIIIYHNLPGNGHNTLPSVEKPTLYIVGNSVNIGAFNKLNTGVTINSRLNKQSEVAASYNESFPHFTIDGEAARQMEQLPPLTAPFGTYNAAPNVQSLFTAKIGNVSTQQPLLAYCQNGARRTAFVFGEGMWKWRLHCYLENSSYEPFDAVIHKTLQYLSINVQQNQFHVSTDSRYREGDAIAIEATLYDDNYEPTNNPAADISISGNGETRQYAFNRSANRYTLNVGTLPPGQYRYKAQTTFNQKKLSEEGSFVVEAYDLESVNLVANHGLLRTLAESTGGIMLSPKNLDTLPTLLKERDDLKTVIYSHSRYTPLLNLPLLLIALLVLLAAEWVTRKVISD